MGWWEKQSSQWSMAIVAQMGGVVGGGGGAFFISFKSPDLPVKPTFLNLALAFGVGGSIGSAVGISWSTVVRQLVNPKAALDPDAGIYGAIDGTFSCKDIQRKRISIATAGGSAVLIGASLTYVRCYEPGDSEDGEPDQVYFTTHVQIPKTLKTVGNAVVDLPQIQGCLSLKAAYFVAAVLIAPIAEEYLFRGLLYRVLDREWHDWRAVAGSAIFFASYHPFAAWLPVGALGVVNALLFRRTGWLVPAIALHMTYNAAVVGWEIARPG